MSHRADEAQRARLNDLFAELCAIESPSGRERACAERVRAELRALGLEVHEDGAAAETGAECGNLLARIPGPNEHSVLLCAHLDTVPLLGPIEPALEGGYWHNRHEAILGADNKAAIAVILEAVRRYAGPDAAAPAPVGIELLFTVSEERALLGAKAFEVGTLRSRFGYVFDHATPIGEVIVAAPTYYRIDAEFRGVAAHAGIRPEAGRSAILAAARAVSEMRLGRLDEETTANVGNIRGGGGSTNVVPERCHLDGECRSLDDGKAEALVTEMVDRIMDAANATEVDVDVETQLVFHGYRTKPTAPEVVAAEAALRACGYEPKLIETGGGSDANAFIRAGFPCVNLANGTERNHQPDERVSQAALEGMLDVCWALLDQAGSVLNAQVPDSG